jgi:4-hydroxy-2-oxoheptanedioate aldolase
LEVREPGGASGAAGLRQRWAAGEPAVGLWSLLPGAATAELLARTGPDFVLLDLQHGALAESELPGVTAAITAAGSVPLVRTRSAHVADVGRPLDLGAAGVLVPNVRGADHVREVVAATRYGPAGRRSFGRLAGTEDDPLAMVMLETTEALDDLDAVLAVEGLDGVYVGPWDLSLALGRLGDEGRASTREVISRIVARAVDAGVPVGVHALGGDDAAAWRAEGTTIVTAGVDTAALSETMTRYLSTVRGGGPR